jgi:hypothetical protein
MDRMIESNRTYLMDRGYAKYELFNRIVEAGTSRSTAEAARVSKNDDLNSRGTLSASPVAFYAASIKRPLEFRRWPPNPPNEFPATITRFSSRIPRPSIVEQLSCRTVLGQSPQAWRRTCRSGEIQRVRNDALKTTEIGKPFGLN